MVEYDTPYLVLLHDQLCEELGVDPASVYIASKHDRFLGLYDSRRKRMDIYVDPNFDMRITMAHETYHHYQASKGWLEGVAYKGKVHEGPHYTDPCERAANRYMAKIAKREGWYETKSKQKA